MHKFYTSSYDASIYLQQPDQNAGRDEILEVGKLYYGTIKDIYRTLIKFDVSNLETGSGWRAYLNLKAAKSEEIPLNYTLYANALSSSWSMGTGTKFDNITSDGVSWKYRDGINNWVDYDTTGGTAVYTPNTTGSANAEGGVWYLSGSASQSFNYESDDVRMDVTDLITQWVSGSIDNNGMVIHHSLDAENDLNDYGVLKFFSKETNTIYQPKLEIVWDDSSINTGSLEPVNGSAEEGYKVVVTNLKTQYEADTQIKVRIKGRDKYPLKSFGTTFAYDQSKYLPETTYYQLEDYITKEIIFPFGDYTKVSCDSTSNYFIMDLSTLAINRTYLLKLKIVEDGISTIIDDKLKFEII